MMKKWLLAIKYAMGRTSKLEATRIMRDLEDVAGFYLVIKQEDGSLYRPTFSGPHRKPRGFYGRWKATNTYVRQQP